MPTARAAGEPWGDNQFRLFGCSGADVETYHVITLGERKGVELQASDGRGGKESGREDLDEGSGVNHFD